MKSRRFAVYNVVVVSNSNYDRIDFAKRCPILRRRSLCVYKRKEITQIGSNRSMKFEKNSPFVAKQTAKTSPILGQAFQFTFQAVYIFLVRRKNASLSNVIFAEDMTPLKCRRENEKRCSNFPRLHMAGSEEIFDRGVWAPSLGRGEEIAGKLKRPLTLYRNLY